MSPKVLKILNIILIAFIVVLVMQMFQPKPNTTPQNAISMQNMHASYTVPAIPQIAVHNTTDKDFSYNTCQNVEIFANSNPIKLSQFEKFCQDVTVTAGQSSNIPLQSLHEVFLYQPGSYVLNLKVGEEQRVSSFTIEKPGMIRSALTALVYNPIYNLFVGIITLLPGHELGWAIILLTIIIRLILLVPQHKMLEGQRKMAELNPKIRALQKEYENDRAQLSVKMLELYKKEGVNPMGACLPLLIQTPILIAMWWVISGITDVVNTYHLYSFLGSFDPTKVNSDFFGLNLLHIGGTLGIIAGIILTVFQWLQSYVAFSAQPPMPKQEPQEQKDGEMPSIDPNIMKNMTLYFWPIVMGVTGFFLPLGMVLYVWIGSVFVIVQQMYVNIRAKKHKKKGEIVKR